jgi:hypothetical protein
VIQIIFVSIKKLKVNVSHATDIESASIIKDEVHVLYVHPRVGVNIVNTYLLLAPIGNPTVFVATVY